MKSHPSLLTLLAPALPFSLLGIFVVTSHQASAAEEDQVMTSRFFEASQKFDAALRDKKDVKEIEKLSDQYLAFLKKVVDPLPGGSPFLGETIQHEIQRLESVKAEYLTAQEKFARIRLDSDWTNCRQYKEATNDFRKVLEVDVADSSPTKRPDFAPDFGKGSTLLGKPFLCSLASFVDGLPEAQGLKSKNKSRVPVGMPGFPKSSFFYHSYDGDFTKYAGYYGSHNESQFKRMYVVTDVWDQVVAVQFTSESPVRVEYIVRYRSRLGSIQGSSQESNTIGMFNFVQFRRKGSSSALVQYAVLGTRGANAAGAFAGGGSGGVLELHTLLRDDGGLKEVNILFLPHPTRLLIEYALSFP